MASDLDDYQGKIDRLQKILDKNYPGINQKGIETDLSLSIERYRKWEALRDKLNGQEDAQEAVAPFKISLKAARVNAGYTVLEAASVLGIGKDTLLKWEKDASQVRPRDYEKIARVYRIPAEYIEL